MRRLPVGLRMMVRLWRRQPVYSFINTLGLAIGLSGALLIALFIRSEMSYDRFHERGDRIVRVTSHYSDETSTRSFARSYPAIGPAANADFPGVEKAIRLQRWKAPMRYGQNQFNEQQIFIVDPSFFDVFSFPLLEGDLRTALTEPGSVVLTRSAARRYFGDRPAFGAEIVMADTTRLRVTGIVADPPRHSHIQFSMLLPMQMLRDSWATRGNDIDATWTAGTFYTYLLLVDTETARDVEDGLEGFVERHAGASHTGVEYRLGLQPIKDIHLRSDLRQEMGPNGSEANLVVFGVVGLILLLISSVNFVNLTTAQSSKRLKEAGVKRALGARRSRLIVQFTSESAVLGMLAFGLSLLILGWFIPWFNRIAGSDLAMSAELGISEVSVAFALSVLVGVLSGLYPAFVLAAERSGDMLRTAGAGSVRAMRPRLRRVLVVSQFFLATGVITCTVISSKQTDYMQARDPGFDSNLIVLPYYWDSSVNAAYPALKEELQRLTVVESVTASGDVPGRMFTSMSYWIEGMPEEERGGITALIVDPDFGETYSLDVLAGRDFSLDQSSELGASFVLNESAVREMGLDPADAVGKTFEMNTRGPIVGVVRDFHFQGLQKAVEPLVMTVWPDWFGYVSVAVAGETNEAVIAEIEGAWRSVLPNRPFEYLHLEHDFLEQYAAERRFGQLFGVFSGLAIFVSCLGLLGLAAFMAEQKTKEIGVRKVFGATVGRLVAHMNREFVVLVLVGSLASVPLTWYLAQEWLADFAYRIEVGPWPFLVSMTLVALLGLATVSYHSIRSALANPVESLRYE